MAITALALLQFLSRFLPSKESIETFPSTICVHQRAHEKYQGKAYFPIKATGWTGSVLSLTGSMPLS